MFPRTREPNAKGEPQDKPMRALISTTKLRIVAAMAALGLAATGCGSDDAPIATATPPAIATPTAVPTATSTPPSSIGNTPTPTTAAEAKPTSPPP
jgi:hypothetical protein